MSAARIVCIGQQAPMPAYYRNQLRYAVTGNTRNDRNAYHLRWLHRPEIVEAAERAYLEDERQHEWKKG